MGLLGISLIVASVVYVIIRPPNWLAQRLFPWREFGGAFTDGLSEREKTQRSDDGRNNEHVAPRIQEKGASKKGTSTLSNGFAKSMTTPSELKNRADASAMPPPPPPTVQPPKIEEPDSPTTPKAIAATPPQDIPSFSLSADLPPLPKPSSSMMPPPLPMSRQQPPAGRLPTLPQFPALNSAQRARGPAPDRGPKNLSAGGLAPPPTHSSKPQKPSRQVTLEPGHSPLDWARISGPSSDLRGVASSKYLQVTPSMLKKQTGRKGKDAWMALNGKVYNITPYAKFHPGGIPELMRGAAKDGTKLFGEVHPWVNYETMLFACLIGVLVPEPQGEAQESEMEKMD
ncbi:hypothetical protein QQS21_011824 [Conoideocrella luteorostrata]|uniref:Cytochrome b5 heme-binding domain-containing protein n=1 Tax=Conoideocrella luteorostrata TaxID=1105319 RepID=A0AAJ0CCK8_9HYPO|nr:hypothetical protein QQS21_011824 [Conoideocrella luteorostrata]